MSTTQTIIHDQLNQGKFTIMEEFNRSNIKIEDLAQYFYNEKLYNENEPFYLTFHTHTRSVFHLLNYIEVENVMNDYKVGIHNAVNIILNDAINQYHNQLQ